MLYDYACRNCGETLKDVKQSIHDDALETCPCCGKNTLERVIYGGLGSFMADSNTIGGKADKNWSRMGSYQKTEIESKNQAGKQAQEKKTQRNKINNMTPEQKRKYIITGE